MANIAITAFGDQFYGAGARQNTLLLCDILTLIGHNVSLILSSDAEVSYSNVPELKKYRFVAPSSDHAGIDLLICSDFTCDNLVAKVKHDSPSCKIVLLVLGSLYYDDMRSMLKESSSQGLLSSKSWIDEVWVSPHIMPDKAYHEAIFYPAKVKVAPYIWSNRFLRASMRSHKQHGFVPDRWKASDQKVIIMEPNLTVQKYFLLPITLCEHAYNQFGVVKDVSVMCADHLKMNGSTMSRVKSFRIYSSPDVNIYFNPRVQLIQALHECGSILVSHQSSCELNYLYLECLSLGLPVVHNSPAFSEVGYYYPENDIGVGALKLKDVIETHDRHQLEYKAKAKAFIEKFSVKNKRNIEDYQKLVIDLLKHKK